MKVEIYDSVSFLDGTVVSFIVPKAREYSKAMFMYSVNNSKGYDITLFMLAEICRVNGQQKSLEYYAELFCDDYVKLLDVLGKLVTPIK